MGTEKMILAPESQRTRRLGATVAGTETEFVVWAPSTATVEVKLLRQGRTVAMQKVEDGTHFVSIPGVGAGETYLYRLGDRERPDPASRLQPQGVHGPSQVVGDDFSWSDEGWKGLPLQDLIIYELHVGTFTSDGTFDSAISRLGYLKSLGITAIELMPVAQFPGGRNWGYDGVFPFAAQNTYGGPAGLKRLVNACHQNGIAVILDVVYNHMGPEGNYLSDFGPYFTKKYSTPWGESLNFDDADNGGVRRFFIENALYWVDECHLDGLRCDAVHAIIDFSANPFLEELCAAVRNLARASNRQIHTIAESDLNDNRVLRSGASGGYAYDAQWSDDFHHALHTLLTSEREGYYEDFGGVGIFRRVLADGWAYAGEYSRHRRRRHGNSPEGLDSERFVVAAQNHDQVGNRMRGERLSHLVDFDRLKLAAAALLTSPFVPMLFMGEEYAEKAPFQYFISHEDAALVEAVRKGRREEFKAFSWAGEAPDPQGEQTFDACKLDPSQAAAAGKPLFDLYRELIRLRKETPSLRNLGKKFTEAGADESSLVIWIHRRFARTGCFMAFNFSNEAASVVVPAGTWLRLLDTQDARWGGSSTASGDLVSDGVSATPLPRLSYVLFSRSQEI